MNADDIEAIDSADDITRGHEMKHSDQGIARTGRAEEQPTDKQRAQTAPRTGPNQSVSHEATRDPKQTNAQKKRDSAPDRKS